MVHILRKQKKLTWVAALVCVSSLCVTTLCFGAKDDPPTTGELMKIALAHVQAERYDEAVVAMYDFLAATEESQMPRVLVIAQDMRYKLILILIKLNRLEEAAVTLEEYIAQPINENPRQSRKMLSTCFFKLENYEKCIPAVLDALDYNENPVVAARKSATGGSGEDVKFEDEEPEVDFTDEEVGELTLRLAESYFKTGKWAEAIPPFEYVSKETKDDQRKGYCIMQIVNALIENKDFDRITGWIPQLYRTTARYDIRVNLALMNAAQALADEQKYDSALPLYRMILPRGELLEFQENKLRKMRINAGLPPDLGAEMSAEEMALFGPSTSEPDEPSQDQPKEITDLEVLIEALKNLPPYENDIAYRMADLYKMVDRPWEGICFFDKVFAAVPESEIGERSVYEIVETLTEALDDPAEAERRGFEYMSKYPAGITSRQIAYMITGYRQQHQQMEELKALKPYLDGLTRSNETTIVRYDVELYFMQAVADLMLLQYEGAEVGFGYVLENFPDSHQEAVCLYWYAMTKLFQQKYEEALVQFEIYIKRFSTGNYIDESYFQSGVCLFGMEKYEEAEERFSLMIEAYPDSSVYAEACSMRGDIFGSRGGSDLDRALVDYERAFSSATKASQATYAVFQMVALYEADNKRHDEIIQVIEVYLDTWEGEADIAKSLYWIGKTKIQQDKLDEAIETYLEAIVTYGGDLRQDGVDMMISELVRISAIYLNDDRKAELASKLQESLEATDDLTLQLRLRVTLAKMNNTETELGLELIKELENLDNASPPVLACICEASFASEDYSRSAEILRIFSGKFEDSDFMRAAYKLRGYGQYDEKDYEGALHTIEEAQENYGTDRDVAWAQLMKAQVLMDQGELEKARITNMDLLTVPSWRGAPVAQATYQLGQIAEKEGDPLKAHAFYQRVYVQYKGHAKGYWAAEAYLAAARCLKNLGLEEDMKNTYKALLFDTRVNELPQAEVARTALGEAEANEIMTFIETGGASNIAVNVEVTSNNLFSAKNPVSTDEKGPAEDPEVPEETVAPKETVVPEETEVPEETVVPEEDAS
jgi:tetratricopeptide (TPR) repeat protein